MVQTYPSISEDHGRTVLWGMVGQREHLSHQRLSLLRLRKVSASESRDWWCCICP